MEQRKETLKSGILNIMSWCLLAFAVECLVGALCYSRMTYYPRLSVERDEAYYKFLIMISLATVFITVSFLLRLIRLGYNNKHNS